jgi:Tol biopolymer transport system component
MMRARRGLFLTGTGRLAIVLVMAGMLLTMVVDQATAIKLNGPLVAGGSVLEAQLTPDGNRIVYLADQDTNGVPELYSVDATGGPVTKLSTAPVAGRAVSAFEITPDGSRVVFLAAQGVSRVELFSVPVTGGPVTRLNDELILILEGSVRSFQLTPDGGRVVFLADQDTVNHVELYSVPVGGGPLPVKLNGMDIVSGGSVLSFQISPDGSRVVYRGDTEVDNLIELFSVPVLGGAITQLSPVSLTEDVAAGFQITPNGSLVLYRAAQDNEDLVELYRVSITGGSPAKLNGALGSGFEVSGFQLTPDGSRVVYRARRVEFEAPPGGDDVTVSEVYSVPVAGGPAQAVKLNGPLAPCTGAAPPSCGSVSDFQITPDGSRVVYRADQDVDNVFELYSVPVQGGTVTKLNPPLVTNGDVLADTTSTTLLVEGPQVTPSGSRVVYRADQTTDEVRELFSVPVGGGVATRLNPPLESNRDIVAFQISPDGTRVVYLSDQDDNGTNELFSVPVEGGPSTKVSQSLADGRTIVGFLVGPNSRRVIYLDGPVPTDPPSPDPVQELYSVEIGTFTDVPPDDIFLPFIEALARSGISSGCATNPPRFCPTFILTRAQMAILLVRGIDGLGAPPPPTGTRFVDVPANAFGAAWIERLAALGLTSGCQASPPRFCPDQGLTRGQMAVFLLKARHGAGYQPPAATGTVFADVPASHLFAPWIEQLSREGITGGCATNPARYCPENPITRGQIAVFLVRALDLPL